MSQPKTSKAKSPNDTLAEASGNNQLENRRSNRIQNTQRDKNFSKDIEKIFERTNPNLSDILNVLKEIFLSQQFLAAKYDEYLVKNEQLEATCDTLKIQNKELRREVQQLQIRVEKTEYILRANNLEIQGIPNEEGNLKETIINVGKAFDIELHEEDIDYIYRIKKPKTERSKKPAPIIVTFKKREVKEKLLSSRKGRSLYAKEIGLSNSENQIYINDHLTSTKKELLWKARQLKKEQNFKYVWYKHDSIYIKKMTEQKQLELMMNLIY